MRLMGQWLILGAAVGAMLALPIGVGAAEVIWGPVAGRRIDDITFETGSFATFPYGGCLGDPAEHRARGLRRFEFWFENRIGWLSPLARRHSRRVAATMSDLRTIATACESYSLDHVDYPRATSLESIRALLEPTYVQHLPMRDAWGNAYAFESDGRIYRVASRGSDGRWEPPSSPHGVTGGFSDPTNRQLLGDLVRKWLRFEDNLGSWSPLVWRQQRCMSGALHDLRTIAIACES